MLVLSAFRIEDLDAAAASFGQGLFQNSAVLEILRNVYLKRHVIRRVILRQDRTEERRRVERIIVGQVLPKEFAAADDSAFAHREKLEGEPLFFAIVADDIDVALGGRRHFLRFAKSENGLVQITILGGDLVFALLGKLPHSLFERLGKFLV